MRRKEAGVLTIIQDSSNRKVKPRFEHHWFNLCIKLLLSTGYWTQRSRADLKRMNSLWVHQRWHHERKCNRMRQPEADGHVICSYFILLYLLPWYWGRSIPSFKIKTIESLRSVIIFWMFVEVNEKDRNTGKGEGWKKGRMRVREERVSGKGKTRKK